MCAVPGAMQCGSTAGHPGRVSVEVSPVQRKNEHTEGVVLQEQDRTAEARLAAVFVGD